MLEPTRREVSKGVRRPPGVRLHARLSVKRSRPRAPTSLRSRRATSATRTWRRPHGPSCCPASRTPICGASSSATATSSSAYRRTPAMCRTPLESSRRDASNEYGLVCAAATGRPGKLMRIAKKHFFFGSMGHVCASCCPASRDPISDRSSSATATSSRADPSAFFLFYSGQAARGTPTGEAPRGAGDRGRCRRYA